MTSYRPWIVRAASSAAAITLLWAAGAAFGATRPRVESPHGRLREECSSCHGAESWKITKISPKFDHGKHGFRLEGAHAAAACTACHTSLVFAKATTSCASCHEDPHRGEMGIDCARCHGARSFIDRGPMVRAHQLSMFPLTGAHAGLDCENCHPAASQGHLQFVGTSSQCRSCHMDQYRAAKDPDHVAASYPLECQSCHATSAWNGATFNHDATRFRLTGAHRAAACAGCHGDGVYAGKPTTCISCHRSDYAAAAPPHGETGFPSAACASCHNTTSFANATFDHSATAFPLTGAHVTVGCAGCHGDGVYAGKPMACASCHQTDYDTASPNHAAAGFATSACASCHNTTAWTGALFSAHDASYFRIYSGRHNGLWSRDCATCHASATNFTMFTCLSCHPHDNQTETDAAHAGRSGYSYDSAACYRCHSRV